LQPSWPSRRSSLPTSPKATSHVPSRSRRRGAWTKHLRLSAVSGTMWSAQAQAQCAQATSVAQARRRAGGLASHAPVLRLATEVALRRERLRIALHASRRARRVGSLRIVVAAISARSCWVLGIRLAILQGLLLAWRRAILAGGIQIVVAATSARSCWVLGRRLATLLCLLLARRRAILAGGTQIVAHRTMSARSCWVLGTRLATLFLNLVWLLVIGATRRALAVQSRPAVEGTLVQHCITAAGLACGEAL
jgi:hypothetical protein